MPPDVAPADPDTTANSGHEKSAAEAALSFVWPFGVEINARATLQASTANLLASEQLFIGGATTVRGYRENIIGGDQGFVLNLEVLTPTIRLPRPHQVRELPQ